MTPPMPRTPGKVKLPIALSNAIAYLDLKTRDNKTNIYAEVIQDEIIDRNDLDLPYYGKIEGPLLGVKEKLNAIAKTANESNIKDVMVSWMAYILWVLINYEENGTDAYINAGKIPYEYYLMLCKQYTEIIHMAFVPEIIDPVQNNDDQEYDGDEDYKHAIVWYVRDRLGIRNKSISSEIKHNLEKTKPLADNARLFSIDLLLRVPEDKRHKTILNKSWDALLEDAFEAVCGVITHIENDIIHDSRAPDAKYLRHNFMSRLVCLIFNNSNIDFSGNKPAKTFVAEIVQKYSRREGKIELITRTDTKIIFRLDITEDAYSDLASKFNVAINDLRLTLGKAYKTEINESIDEKKFLEKVYNTILNDLYNIGVTRHAIQYIKNKNVLENSDHDAMTQLFEGAKAKGYILEINKKFKTVQSGAIMITFRHSIPGMKVINLPAVPINGSYRDALLKAQDSLKDMKDISATPDNSNYIKPSTALVDTHAVKYEDKKIKGIPSWKKHFVVADDIIGKLYSKTGPILTGPLLDVDDTILKKYCNKKTILYIYEPGTFLIIKHCNMSFGAVPRKYDDIVPGMNNDPELSAALKYL